jgi:hypothetical protein
MYDLKKNFVYRQMVHSKLVSNRPNDTTSSWSYLRAQWNNQGILTEGEGPVRLTSLH